MKKQLNSSYDMISEELYLDRINQLIEDLVRLVKEELSLVTRNLVLFGSYAKFRKNKITNLDYFQPGESDIDIALIVDTELEIEPTLGLKKVVESLNSILFEPIYAPILDLTILEAQIDIPPPIGANFSLLQLHGARSSGMVLYGKESYLRDFEFSNHDYQLAALSEVSKLYSDLKNAYLHRDMYRVPELFWLGVDSVLLSGLTFSNYLKFTSNEPSLVKLEVSDFLNNQDIPQQMKNIVDQAIDFSLNGGPPEGHFDYFMNSLGFTRKINEYLRK